MNLADILRQVLPVEVEGDGALTVRYEGTFASLRTLQIVEGLDVISLNQLLAWDLAVSGALRDTVAGQAGATMFGTVLMTEDAGGTAEVMLRYNFPAGGLDERALQTLVLMVLSRGAEVARAVSS